jgi:Dyp-type peroxidase family
LTRELGAHLDHVCAQLGLDVAVQAAGKAPQLVGYQDLHRPLVESGVKSVGAYGIEYFGFRDGIGQPALPSSTPLAASAVGSSGWLKERASYDVVLRTEPSGLLKNATFLVARQLRQDPEAFWRTIQSQAQALATNKRELAEQILGRRMDGRRLDSTQAHFDADRDRLAFDPDRETPSCPFHSHVRRANPRTEASPARNPQVMRRSLAYLNPRGDAYAKGLMFIAFNADIETQFELIQRNWIQAGNQVGLSSHDRDVLVGLETAPKPHAPTSAARFYAAAAPDSRELRFEKAFVTLEWGVYLYFPARDALNQL